MFKVLNNHHPYIINNIFSLISISHKTMNLNNVYIFNFKKEMCRRTVIYVGLISWNKLNNILKIISNYKLFRNHLYKTCHLHIQNIKYIIYIYIYLYILY